MSNNMTANDQKIEAFTFGDPTPVLDGRDMMDYIECWKNGKWYEPPISFQGLAKSFRAATHHSSPIYFKRNVLASLFIPHRLLSRSDFTRWALDYLIFGNGYLEKRVNRLGEPLKLVPSLAKYTRRGLEPDSYWFVRGWGEEHEFKAGSIHHLVEPDINQEIYGLPEYLSSLNSAWLNESATLFRRKYYQNGSHAGFILYMTDTANNETDVSTLRQALRDSKGPGNFRNLFMYAPGGKKDGMQLLPISEVAAKDEIFNIKNVTRDDMLAAHRVPVELMGIMPSNTGGFGKASEAAQVFATNELLPLQMRLQELNEWVGEEVVKFQPYEVISAVQSA
ncbi:phage portal protein [Motiliproteus sp.]|uniref:phage portal protein n=1 Tax=Motiliproteus sp. TaxID=1898955 RepID=UPI003BAD4D0B